MTFRTGTTCRLKATSCKKGGHVRFVFRRWAFWPRRHRKRYEYPPTSYGNLRLRSRDYRIRGQAALTRDLQQSASSTIKAFLSMRDDRPGRISIRWLYFHDAGTLRICVHSDFFLTELCGETGSLRRGSSPQYLTLIERLIVDLPIHLLCDALQINR